MHPRHTKTEFQFQPTPPTRTETETKIMEHYWFRISTHSAHEDGDWTKNTFTVIRYNFNPLRPRGRRLYMVPKDIVSGDFNPLRPRGRRPSRPPSLAPIKSNFNPLRPRGRRQQYYTKKPTILHHISTIKSHHTPSNHRQPTLHTSKTVLIVQFFRCESPRKFMFASGSHQTI